MLKFWSSFFKSSRVWAEPTVLIITAFDDLVESVLLV
jgi:hypothetical protein